MAMMPVVSAMTAVAHTLITALVILRRVMDDVVFHPLRGLVAMMVMMVMITTVTTGILQGIGGQATYSNTHQNRRRITMGLRLIRTQGACCRNQNGRRQPFRPKHKDSSFVAHVHAR